MAAWRDQRRQYRQLRHRKCSDFWSAKVEADQSDPRRLWKLVDTLLGRGSKPVSSTIDVEAFSRHFVDKVDQVRLKTSGAPGPTFTPPRVDTALRAFKLLSSEDIAGAIRTLPDVSSAADPMPTFVLKQVADLLLPFIEELFNRSLTVGHFPVNFRDAFITPIVKKPGMDASDVRSYRPISNLSVLSKLLERLVARQLTCYLNAANLLPQLQSGFRSAHSTETAIFRVLSDLLQAVDRGDVAVLVLLDLSAAFDTVDHEILLQRLDTTFGLRGSVLDWFRSYLSDRSQYVRCGPCRSATSRLTCGVPQGSVLGPILFIMYTADLIALVEKHDLSAHLYADDTQLYGWCHPGAVDGLSTSVSTCLADVSGWMRANRLCLNPDKTEVLWCTTNRRQHQLPTSALLVDGASVTPVKTVRDLGVFVDSDLGMRSQVQRTVSSCFAALRQLRQLRRSVPPTTLRTLVAALVTNRLDYANSVLVGLPAYLARRLQSVLNSAARLILHLRSSDHITNALISLHWLRVMERITFKTAVLMFKVLHGSAPQYLGPFARVADHPGRQGLRSATSQKLLVPVHKLATVGSRAFPVAGAKVWNKLPPCVTSCTTLSAFRRELKRHLFLHSYPDLRDASVKSAPATLSTSGPSSSLATLATLKIYELN